MSYIITELLQIVNNQEAQPTGEKKVLEDWKADSFNDEEASYYTHTSEKWWPIDDLLGVNLMTSPDYPNELSQTANISTTPNEPRYKNLPLKTKVPQLMQSPSEIKRLLLQKPRTHSGKCYAEVQLCNIDKQESKEQIQKHEMHPSLEDNEKHAQSFGQQHNSTPVPEEHNYCLQPKRMEEIVSDSFIANCLLNPNLEDEVLRETKVMRVISKKGLIFKTL